MYTADAPPEVLARRICLELKELILSGELPPGARLQEVDLSRRWNVSRTPIREALRVLEMEGLVMVVPRKGASVAHLSREDIQMAYELRLWLEPRIAGKAALSITEPQVHELQVAIEEMPDSPEDHDAARRVEILDIRFHDFIARVADNGLATSAIADARVITQRAAYWVPIRRYQRSKEEHRALLAALAMHDADAAEEVMRAHLLNASERMFLP